MKGSIRLIRALEWYQVVGQELIGEIALPELAISHLEQLFGVQEDDPLYFNMYRVNENHVSLMKEHLQHEFNFQRFSYFISCTAISNK